MSHLEKNSKFPYLLAVILTLLLINTVRSVFDIHTSIGKIDEAKFELEALKTQNTQLKSDLEYAKSPEYLQRAAIEELNMAKPGETIIIVEQLTPDQAAQEVTDIPKYQPEPLELWMAEFNLEEYYYASQRNR